MPRHFVLHNDEFCGKFRDMKPRSEPISEEERAGLDKGLSALVYAKDEDEKKREKELRDDQVARQAEERKKKETILTAPEVSEWQKEERRLEAEGVDTRQPETVVMGGEGRTDWDPMRK